MGILKVAVLGLGPTLSWYKPNEFDLSVGVNDIWRFHQTSIVVCLDYRGKFTDERFSIIDKCTPNMFVSHLPEYRYRPDFHRINFQNYYPDERVDLEDTLYPKSINSPFVAAVVAFKICHATEIHLFGVDFVDHPKLYGEEKLGKIKLHFKNLKHSLQQCGCELVVRGYGILSDL
jgi:hypothetical protein